jgi:hypothetical protein
METRYSHTLVLLPRLSLIGKIVHLIGDNFKPFFLTNWEKYYVKKLCKKDIKGQQKIGDVFKKINKGNDQSSEIKSEIRQVLDYIIMSLDFPFVRLFGVR